MTTIRAATPADASRLAEILIFTKRTRYRSIFQDDQTSFGEMQVLPLALHYRDDPESLRSMYVYDDGIVKGLIHIEGEEINELYVDPFFQGEGVGSALMRYALEQYGCRYLWVLEKNTGSISFYQHKGFCMTRERKLQEGTPEYIVKMERVNKC